MNHAEFLLKLAIKLDVTCSSNMFGSFGKYRNRTERTDTELARYRIFSGTDRYQFSHEPNLYEYRGTEPIVSVLPNAQGELDARTWPRGDVPGLGLIDEDVDLLRG